MWTARRGCKEMRRRVKELMRGERLQRCRLVLRLKEDGGSFQPYFNPMIKAVVLLSGVWRLMAEKYVFPIIHKVQHLGHTLRTMR